MNQQLLDKNIRYSPLASQGLTFCSYFFVYWAASLHQVGMKGSVSQEQLQEHSYEHHGTWWKDTNNLFKIN